MGDIGRRVARWVEAGVIDADAAARIRAFEAGQHDARGLSWTVRIILGFGGMLLAAGVLLFIAAHWDGLSPSGRFGVLLATIGSLHALAAAASRRVPVLATVLHAVGTVAFGGAIFLAGQIFHLDAHWPAGLMLWALGAAAAWLLLRDGLQLTLVSLLAPAWLVSEWSWLAGNAPALVQRVSSAGVLLLAVTYLTAEGSQSAGRERRVLTRVGSVMLLPAALAFALNPLFGSGTTPTSAGMLILGWSVSLGVPLALAFLLHRAAAWAHLVAALWIGLRVILLGESIHGRLPTYGWWALAAAGLAAWGVRDRRPDWINFAFAIFGGTVLTFYFAGMSDMLGRSAGLIGLGVLLLAGGYALERGRRHLVRSVKGDPA